MKYLIPILFLLSGLTIGFFVGKFTSKSGHKQVTQVVNDKENIKVVHDTIVKTEVISEKPTPSIVDTLSENNLDSLNYQLDTLQVKYLEKNTLDSIPTDTTDQEEININRDKKLDSKVVKIIYLNEQKTSKSDSLINEMIEVKPIKQTEFLVEFWESPINYNGYKMSKVKIVTYGLNPQFDYQIYYKDHTYFLNFENEFYQLKETSVFKPFLKVEKSTVLND
ncbi:MAG: hypothetical protein ACWA41_00275 [Putridiphycobacter sp.]